LLSTTLDPGKLDEQRGDRQGFPGKETENENEDDWRRDQGIRIADPRERGISGLDRVKRYLVNTNAGTAFKERLSQCV
jgi:hypothetical protein